MGVKRSCAEPLYPNLFLAGAPKCGTTALSYYLAKHPDIFMSEEIGWDKNKHEVGWKEPGYFTEDANELFAKRFIKTWEDYISIFDHAASTVAWRGEATVSYLSSKVAIPRILSLNPDAHFIIVVRNPLEIAYAMHNDRVKLGRENIIDFESAWHAQKERLHGKRLPHDSKKNAAAFQYGDLARIGTQLNRLLEHVPKDQVHVIVYDDLVDDPVATYKRTLCFLGLEYDGYGEFDKLNESRSIRSTLLAQSLVSLNRVRKRIGVPGLGTGIYRKIYSANLAKGKNPLNPKVKQELQEYFDDEVELLSKLLGRDVRHWLT